MNMKKILLFILVLFTVLPMMGTNPPVEEIHYSIDGINYASYLIPASPAEVIPNESWGNVYGGEISGNIPTYSIRFGYDTHVTRWYLYYAAPTYKALGIPDSIVSGYQRPVSSISRMSHFVKEYGGNWEPDTYINDNTYLETVQLNNIIGSIPYKCFYRCVNLKHVFFSKKPNKIYYIDEMAFGGCPELSIRLPRFCYTVMLGLINNKYRRLGNLGDSIRKLEVVWNEPPLADVSDPMLIQKLYELRQTGQIKPLFQYVDTLVVPKGCLQNYVDWQDIKYGVIMEGDYEAEGKYIYDNAEYDEYLKETSIENTSCDSRQNMHDNQIYDLQGRRLNGIPKRGLYIRNGKKYH